MANSTLVAGTANSYALFRLMDIPSKADIKVIRSFATSAGKIYRMVAFEYGTYYYLLRIYGGKWGNKFKLDEFADSNELDDSIYDSVKERMAHGYVEYGTDDSTKYTFVQMINAFDVYYLDLANFFNVNYNTNSDYVFETHVKDEVKAIINRSMGQLYVSRDDMIAMNKFAKETTLK